MCPATVASAVGVFMVILKKRSDFLRTAKAEHRATAGFVLQGRKRLSGETPTDTIRVGFTCSKKVGNAVARNRAKRRLRAIAEMTLIPAGIAGWDYVLIGRARATADLPFETLNRDLQSALSKIHQTIS